MLQKEVVQNCRVLDPDAGLVNCDSLGSGMQDSVLRISLLESSLHTLKLEKWTPRVPSLAPGGNWRRRCVPSSAWGQNEEPQAYLAGYVEGHVLD